MSAIILNAAIRGAAKYIKEAEERLKSVIEEKGERTEIGYANTAYYLPLIYAFLGIKVKTLLDLHEALAQAKKLIPRLSCQEISPSLQPALDAGIAALIAEEALEAIKSLTGQNSKQALELGFTGDAILRQLGIKLVDGRMPGFAVCVGSCPTNQEAVKLIRQLQERNILVFFSSSANGKSMAEQLAEEKIEMGWDNFLVPYGKDTSATVHTLDFAVRVAMTFGGINPSSPQAKEEILLYNKKRVKAFILALGTDPKSIDVLSDEKYATVCGALNFGFPVISDTAIPAVQSSEEGGYDLVVPNVTLDKIVSKAIEVRGVKLKFSSMPIPVSYGSGFEGERVRKNEMHVQFGGKSTLGFELARMRQMSEVEDGRIELIGPDIDSIQAGEAMPLGFIVEVAGKKMQQDFEAVLERYIHHFISCAHGVMHTGQRNIIWHRISKEAYESGFRLRHLGEITHLKFLEEFSSIVDKVQITIYTVQQKVEELLKEAEKIYAERDCRMAKMSDEDVEVFFSCRLCQSYAPNHVCIITPERLGLCGAYTWLDARAGYEVNPYGGNEPVFKEETIEPLKGQWQGVNTYVYAKSNKAIERFNAYSIIDYPETSCGCFECIVAVLPEANGVMVVNREFNGITPVGMSFSSLANMVGGGRQTPGFIGVGKFFITSKKFISAEGGIRRLVWMPKELKEAIKQRLVERTNEIGVPDLIEKIADETVATTIEELLPYLKKVKHPALEMEPIM